MYSPERRELVERAFRGDPIGRPLVSLWRHWPEQDQDADALAAAHVDFQRRYDFDFAKFTPSGTDCVEDWGVETRFSGDPHGTRDVLRRGVSQPADWERLPPLDFTRTKLGRHLGAIAALRRELGPDVPILQTAFSPLTAARKLAGDRVVDDLRTHPESVRRGLERIAADTLRYVDLSLDAGADGLFFATQVATRDLLTDEEHRRWGVEYDRRLLEAARRRTGMTVLHAHGSNLIWEQLLDYPVPALNWHDRAVGPSLAEMKTRFSGLLVGGLDEWGCLLEGPPTAVRAQVEDAVAQAGDRNLCLAAGCVIGYRTPDRHIRAVRAAVKV
jgi:uroporphyrinogen decarboxylase